MWNNIATWYRGWEQEQLDVLETPVLASQAAPGYRRKVADKLAALSQVERMQLRAFSLKYRGWRVYAAIAKLMFLFTLCGVVLHLLLPHKGLMFSVMLVNALGLAGLMMFFVAYFSYRQMQGKLLRSSLRMMLFAGLAALATSTQIAMHKGAVFRAAIETLWGDALLTGIGAGLLYGIPMLVVGTLRNQQYESLTANLELEAERHRAAHELSEARLRLLHAQIEPHFLFNTLGAVQQLAEKEAPRAAELTANLIAFLRASMTEMRSERVTLAADFGMVGAYLEVMSARLGARLSYQLALAPELGAASVPSMMLLTLVENAIKHGIEPALRGGSIQVSAQRDDGHLRLSVRDSGAGLAATPGAGAGLENVRSRLQLIYAGQAALSVAEHADGGVLAEITLPYDTNQGTP